MKYTKQFICYNKKGGYIALISVLILGAIGISITVSLLQLGLGSSRQSFANEQSAKANSAAYACAEEALRLIQESSFMGIGNLSLGTVTCTYDVTSQGGQTRTINASGLAGGNVRKIKITVNKISPAIEIATWQEVADF